MESEEKLVTERKNANEKKTNDINSDLKKIKAEKDLLEKEAKKSKEKMEKIQVWKSPRNFLK